MILPSNDECRRIVQVLLEETDLDELTEWEYEFLTSNQNRTSFSDKQKQIFHRLSEKYDTD